MTLTNTGKYVEQIPFAQKIMRNWFATTTNDAEWGKMGIRTSKMKQNNIPPIPLKIIFPKYLEDDTTVFAKVMIQEHTDNI